MHIELDSLPVGQYRELSQNEIEAFNRPMSIEVTGENLVVDKNQML
jgi:hypothetical protein